MIKKIQIFLVCFLFIASFVAPTLLSAEGSRATDLRKLIDEKGVELQELQKQREALEKNLEEINKSSNKLSKEIKTANNQISQLELIIKGTKLSIEKLELEADSLRSDILNIESDMQNQKQTIIKLFGELQQRDNENLLIIFLRNKSLGEAVSEVRSIEALNNNLWVTFKELERLQDDLRRKADDEELKKRQKIIEQRDLKNRQYILADQKKEKQTVLTVTKNQEKIYEDQLEELKKLQAEISKEIGDIESELRKNIDLNLLPMERPDVITWPVENARVTQGYGSTPFALRNYASKHHNGIDIGGFLGKEILSAESGIVINVGDQDKFCRGGAYGRFVVIKHENGLTTLYGHMSRYIVSVGQKVERGEVVGYMGKTGWATGIHLHFTVFASQTLTPAKPGFPEGTKATRVCGPMPVGGDLDPTKYLL